MSFNVAIDGPAGAGKSTVAKAVAAKRNFIYVDTGAMYRTMALYFLRKGIDKNDEAAVNRACREVSITIAYENGVQQVFLNGENVSGLIRTEEVGNMASATSGYLPVREKLVELQKEMARNSDVVMDGRDIGTCVLPEADVKIYLTASSLVRAKRRFRELTEKGTACDLKEIEQDIIDRDYRDMHREHSPLVQAEDAVYLDSSDMTLEQVVDAIGTLIDQRMDGRAGGTL
ncbi:MAG: (d)CMP kinase [Sakamotonia sp.]|jgi:cytidylate kinase